jgi:hypothetical protein
MDQVITKLHPNLLVLTSSDYVGRAEPDAGKFTPHHQRTWLKGAAAVFRTLRHAADHVVLLANLPRLLKPAWQCVADHTSNVFPCAVPRSNAFQYPTARRREMRLAASDGITVVDPTPWFCTSTRCPVIANHILIFRDSQHITPEWSEFLAPMLSNALSPVLGSPVPVTS